MQTINTQDGLFHDGNPSTGELGTIVPASWLNSIQAELLSVLAAGNIAPDQNKQTQVTEAIKKMVVAATATNTTGSPNAITATFTPAISTLTNGLRVLVRAIGPNSITSPTLKTDGAVAKAITKAGGYSLAPGDIVGSGHWLDLVFDSALDRWELQNPNDGVKEVGQNVLVNSTGALGAIGWTFDGGWVETLSQFGDGSYFVMPTLSSTATKVQISDPILWRSTSNIYLSAEMFAGGVTSGAFYLDIQYLDSGWNVLGDGPNLSATNGRGWTRYYAAAETPPSNTAYIKVRLVLDNVVSNNAAARNIKVSAFPHREYSDEATLRYLAPKWKAKNIAGSGPITLSADDLSGTFFDLQGTLTGARTVIVPNGHVGRWWVRNYTTGGYPVTIKTAAGIGVVLNPGEAKDIAAEGSNVLCVQDGVSPAGLVAHFAMANSPAGWLKANGAAVNRTAYAALFAAIGTTYGTGDGSTTFNLPDLRGEFVRGWDDGRGVDTSRTLGAFQQGSHITGDNGIAPAVHGIGNLANCNFDPSDGAVRDIYYVPNATVLPDSNYWGRVRPRNLALLACIKY